MGEEAKRLLEEYPVVILLGPRQSGKTTLARHLCPGKPYINLEAPDTRERIAADPRGFFASHPQGAILDEIQRFPLLLSYIQEQVDAHPKTTGLYILTGSHQTGLSEAIGQSLAGRTRILRLYPFSLREIHTPFRSRSFR